MIAGSKVTPSSAAEIARCEMPSRAASCLKAASQASKLPVLRQRAQPGLLVESVASTTLAASAAPKIPKIRRLIVAALAMTVWTRNVPLDFLPSSWGRKGG